MTPFFLLRDSLDGKECTPDPSEVVVVKRCRRWRIVNAGNLRTSEQVRRLGECFTVLHGGQAEGEA